MSRTVVLLRQLENHGVFAEPSDAQQMLLEMLPDALWEIVDVTETIDPTSVDPNTLTVVTQVTVVRLINGETDMVVDVLNRETTQVTR